MNEPVRPASASGRENEAGHSLAGMPLAAMLVDIRLPGSPVILTANPAARALELAETAIFTDALGRLAAAGTGLETIRVALPAAAGARGVELTLLPGPADAPRLLLLRDTTGETNLVNALTESRQRYKDLVEASSDFAWETGADGGFVFVSSRGALGWPAAALIGGQARELMVDPPADGPLAPFAVSEAVESYEFWMRDAAGGLVCLIASALPLFDAAGAWRGARGVCRDITALKARDRALAAARNRDRLKAWFLRTIAEVVDPEALPAAAVAAVGRVLEATGVLLAMDREGCDERISDGELPGEPPDTAPPRDGVAEVAGDGGRWLGVATRHLGQSNGALWLWFGADGDGAGQPGDSAEDGEFLSGLAGHIAIVIEQVAQHRELERLSSTDALTGLDNRRAFLAALEQRTGVAGRVSDSGGGALIYVDLDNFKQVNDVCGHARGDEALVAVASILRDRTRTGDRAARLGGDEFALWLEGIDGATAERRTRELLAAAGKLAGFSAPGGKPLGFSIGMALWQPGSGEALDDLVERADAAMYEAKRQGKGTFRIAPPHRKREDG